MTTSSKGRERFSVDTNVLVYAVDTGAGEKHYRAQRVIETLLERDCVLTLQSLAEFYFTVTRKGKLEADVARIQVEGWQTLFSVVSAKPATLGRAIEVARMHHLSFWDAMLWATAREAGVTVLLSEDFQDGQVLDGVRIINPFGAEEIGGWGG